MACSLAGPDHHLLGLKSRWADSEFHHQALEVALTIYYCEILSQRSLLRHAARDELGEGVRKQIPARGLTRETHHADVVSVEQNLGHLGRSASVIA